MLILEENVKQHLKCTIHFHCMFMQQYTRSCLPCFHRVQHCLCFFENFALRHMLVLSSGSWDSLRTLNSFKFIKTGVILCFCMFV